MSSGKTKNGQRCLYRRNVKFENRFDMESNLTKIAFFAVIANNKLIEARKKRQVYTWLQNFSFA